MTTMQKQKFLTFSFDDCEIYDRLLCEMLRKYNLKATFFLISGQLSLRRAFHRYGEDTMVERICPEEIRRTYAGMEVATHTQDHKCSAQDLDTTVLASARYLSSLCGYEVKGMAYPGGIYTKELVKGLKAAGIRYARTTCVTHSFTPPVDWLTWNPTCKYDDPDIWQLADDFLNLDGSSFSVFHIYGHSYEMTRREKGCDFGSFEALLQKLSGKDDIVYATNSEVMELLNSGR